MSSTIPDATLEEVDEYELNKKEIDARLSDEDDIVEAWLTNRVYEDGRGKIKKVSNYYMFERKSEDVLQLAEIQELCSEPDVEIVSDIMTLIAVMLIQDGKAYCVLDTAGNTIVKLETEL